MLVSSNIPSNLSIPDKDWTETNKKCDEGIGFKTEDLSRSLCLYLSVSLFLLCLSRSVCLSIYLSVCLSVSVSLSV